jgi:hypothetical protein
MWAIKYEWHRKESVKAKLEIDLNKNKESGIGVRYRIAFRLSLLYSG